VGGFWVHHHWLRIEKPAGCSAACKSKGFVIASIDESKVANQFYQPRPSAVCSKGGVDGHGSRVGTNGNELSFPNCCCIPIMM